MVQKENRLEAALGVRGSNCIHPGERWRRSPRPSDATVSTWGEGGLIHLCAIASLETVPP